MSTLNAARILRVALSLPSYGAWRANVTLESGDTPTGAATLTVGDLVLQGTVAPALAGEDAPEKPHAIVTGGAGWERAATSPLSYEGPSLVRLSTVLTDLAARAAEKIEAPADITIGKQWACLATTNGEPVRLRDALAVLRRDRFVGPWRVDPDGVTRFGPRIGGAITSRATQLRRDAGAGLRVVGIDSPAAFLPGNSIEGDAILRTVIMETSGKLTAELWTAPTSIRTATLRMMAESFPQLFYGHARTYLVSAVAADGRIDCVPPAEAPHLPPLPKVEQWGLGGARATPLIGSRVVVGFRDASPSRPFVYACEPLEGSVPTKVEIDAAEVDAGGALDAAARYGDAVAIDPITGVLSFVASLSRPVVSRVKV